MSCYVLKLGSTYVWLLHSVPMMNHVLVAYKVDPFFQRTQQKKKMFRMIGLKIICHLSKQNGWKPGG